MPYIAFLDRWGNPAACYTDDTRAKAHKWAADDRNTQNGRGLIAYTKANKIVPKHPYPDELSSRSVAFSMMQDLIRRYQ